MYKILLILTVSFFPACMYAQNKHLSLGIEGNGICFGNSANYNGIRVNLLDKNVNNVNGINLTGLSRFNNRAMDSVPKINGLNITVVYSNAKRVNGISANILADSMRESNGIIIGGFGSFVIRSNGINAGGIAVVQKSNGINLGFFSSMGGSQNGISASFFYTQATKVNGIALSQLFNICDTLNGVAYGFLGVGFLHLDDPFGDFADHAVGSSDFSDHTKDVTFLNGFALGGCYVVATKMNGMAVSALFNQFDTLRGCSVSTVNITKQLHGFQFGLLNHAANNKPPFRWTPFFNFNLRRKASG